MKTTISIIAFIASGVLIVLPLLLIALLLVLSYGAYRMIFPRPAFITRVIGADRSVPLVLAYVLRSSPPPANANKATKAIAA